MTRYDDNNPQHRKELHEYLTRPASKSKGAFRNFTKEQKTVNANELESLIKKTEKELSEDKIVTKTNNQKPKIDFLRKILLEEMKQRDLDESEVRYLVQTKPRSSAMAKAPGAAKPFIKTKKKPVVDQTPIKIDSSPIKFRSPVYQPDYAALQAANRLRQLQRQSELQKIKDANTGIGYLVGGLRFKS